MTQFTPPSISLGTNVTEGKSCHKCGYALTGLSPNGLCPECGTPVTDSLRGILLQYASADYLREVRSGLSLYLNGILVSIVVGVIGAILGFTAAAGMTSMSGVQPIATGLSLIPAIMMLLGFWKYTTPDPGYSGQENPNSARQVARIALIVSAIGTAASTVLQFTGAAAAWTPGMGTGGAGGAAVGAAAILMLIVTIIGGIASLVQFFAGIRYTKWMFGRVPDAEEQKKCDKYMWMLPLIYILLACVAIGPLIALVLYWNLLHRLRKYMKTLPQ